MDFFFLLPLAILPLLAYLFIKKTEIIPGILIFSLPLYLFRLPFLGASISLFEIILTLAFFVYFFKNPQEVKNTYIFFKKSLKQYPQVIVPFSFFVLFSFLSIFKSPDPLSALKHFKVFFFDPILFSCLLISILKNRKNIQKLDQFIALLLLLLGFFAILEYFLNFSPTFPWNGIVEARRITFPFPHPNFFTLFLMPFWVYLFTKYFKNFKKIILISLIVSGCSLILTFSLLSLFSLLATILLYLVFIRKSFKVPLFILSIIVLLVLVVPPSRDFIALKAFSLDERITIWRGSLNLLAQNPLSGAGLKGFETSYGLYRLPEHITSHPYPHNLFLALWIETSLGGLISFLIALTALLIYLMANKKEAVLSSQFFFPFVLILIHGLFDTPFFKNDLAVIFFFFFILSLISLQRKGDHLFDS